MDQLPPLQQILGTDKKNPVFTIYRDAKEQILHVYYGCKLLEKVPDDKRHPEFKLLLARLSNSGVKATVLERVFGVDHKTMKRWGSALTRGDPEFRTLDLGEFDLTPICRPIANLNQEK